MSISSKIALAMSADGASFEEVHTSLEKITEEFAIGFAEWVIYGHITLFRDNPEQLLEIFKKEKDL
jgi:hypothetical protein